MVVTSMFQFLPDRTMIQVPTLQLGKGREKEKSRWAQAHLLGRTHLIFGAISIDQLAPDIADNHSYEGKRAICGAARPSAEDLFDWLHRACAFEGDRSIVGCARSILPPGLPVIRYPYRGDDNRKLPLFSILY